MKPPYDLTSEIFRLVARISEKLGESNAYFLDRPSPKLRKQNKIKTIHSSLGIEGNTLSEEQITALIENKRVLGPEKDIREVLNAISIYDNLDKYDPNSISDFLQAHSDLLDGLAKGIGAFRTQGVGVVKGLAIQHLAPPHENIPGLMNDLFEYLKDSEELVLIKSCVFHYEMEFIHPFLDGNGRMGRLWQTLILKETYPIFEFLPFETLIFETQNEYYQALATSDKTGKSTAFISYMLNVIDRALNDMLKFNSQSMNSKERLAYFLSSVKGSFVRKEYMNVFKNISTATASRDLQKGVEYGYLEKMGEKNKTVYTLKKTN